MSEGEVLVDTEGLARALHHAMAWQYDECDHGKYVGGPNDGQPYAMCEIFARRVVWVLRDEKTKLTLAGREVLPVDMRELRPALRPGPDTRAERSSSTGGDHRLHHGDRDGGDGVRHGDRSDQQPAADQARE